MSYTQIWIHAVWGTKRREPLMNEKTIPLICEHIRQNAKQKGFYVIELNAVADHMHCLMALRSDWSVARQMQMIKGEAANWINRQSFMKTKFEWADEYFASSVSKDKLDIVRAYIRNQQEHHRKVSFAEEYKRFLEIFGIDQG